MMKLNKLVIAIVFLIFSAGVSTHATTIEMNIMDEVLVKKDPKKTEISPTELPETVKDAIKEGEYAKWKIVKAYIITYSDDSEKVEYEVHFTNKKEKKDKQIIVYDKNGKLIDD